MTNDYLWRPLVLVQPGQTAFLLHFGSGIPPRQLEPGWHWHWPLLSHIRILNQRPYVVSFGEAQEDGQPVDRHLESIVAISRDHHLFRLSGQISLTHGSLSANDQSVLLSSRQKKLERYIEAMIRQVVRQVIAGQQSRQLASPSLTQLNRAILKELDLVLDDFIDCQACQLELVEPFRSLQPSEPLA